VRYRGVCSTALVRLGKVSLRIAWTHAGIAFVDHASVSRQFVERRLKMRLEPRAVPKLIRATLLQALRGDAGAQDGAPIDLSWARDYEREVLLAAMNIPHGQTRPYSWLAREARRPLAVRAASAIAKNPLWLLVPCHRVIAADGSIGSYGPSGIRRKRELLAREGVVL
jgi:O-6-methylguanine DNA methyltransferase